MSKKVWVSLIMVDSTLIKQLRSDIGLTDTVKALDAAKRHRKGEWLPADCFPKEFFAHHHDRKEKKLPNIFFADVCWCVSAACAEVLLKFDLGKGGVYPVKMLQHDRMTPIEGEYFCLNFGAQKTALVRQRSTGLFKPWDHSDDLWLHGEAKDYDVGVSAVALEGADLWMDPTLGHAVFLSDRLVNALQAAKLTRRFKLRKCRIVEVQ